MSLVSEVGDGIMVSGAMGSWGDGVKRGDGVRQIIGMVIYLPETFPIGEKWKTWNLSLIT